MTMTYKKPFPDLSSAALHIMAMAFMLCDHLWATLVPGNDWLTNIGRLAFPIFAFLIVEGYFHTSDLKRYIRRLLICAVVSEIPFNLMYAGSPFYIFHQNVIWTFLIGICMIRLNEKAGKTGKIYIIVLTAAGTVLLGYILGFMTFADYNGAGVLMVLAFYFFRGRKWWCLAGQFICLMYLNIEVLGGFYFNVEIFGKTFEIVRQGLAVLALIPIWLYRGRKGYGSRSFQYICYGFYPVHMLILYIVRALMFG